MQKKNAHTTIIECREAPEVAIMMPDMLAIDVRTPAEFEARHIPGSHNIPLDQLPLYKEEIAQRVGNARLLLLCQSGARARKAAELLQTTPLASLIVLDGGLAAWEQAGQPVHQGTPKWSLERQVRGVAGTLIVLSTLGSLVAWKPLVWIAALVGGGLAYSAVSNTCGMAMVLSKLPYNQGAACNVRDTLNNIGNVARDGSGKKSSCVD